MAKERRPQITEEMREELDQSMRWWDREYHRLVKAAFTEAPFNPDEHVGHRLIEVVKYTGGGRTFCAECQPRLVPRAVATSRHAGETTRL